MITNLDNRINFLREYLEENPSSAYRVELAKLEARRERALVEKVVYYYRYEDVQYAGLLNEYDEPQGPGRLAVELRTYEVVGTTPKGVWIDDNKQPRFILSSATKRFALPTREEALTSFMARKSRQITILTAQLNRAERAHFEASCMKEKEANGTPKTP